MSFTVREFSDLIEIINTQPEWRQRMREALFPDLDLKQSWLDLQRSLCELAEERKLTEQMLRRMSERLDEGEARGETGFAEAAAERRDINARLDAAARDHHCTYRIEARLNRGFTSVKHDIGMLKDESYERAILDRAVAIFGSSRKIS